MEVSFDLYVFPGECNAGVAVDPQAQWHLFADFAEAGQEAVAMAGFAHQCRLDDIDCHWDIDSIRHLILNAYLAASASRSDNRYSPLSKLPA